MVNIDYGVQENTKRFDSIFLKLTTLIATNNSTKVNSLTKFVLL